MNEGRDNRLTTDAARVGQYSDTMDRQIVAALLEPIRGNSVPTDSQLGSPRRYRIFSPRHPRGSPYRNAGGYIPR